MVGNLTNAQLSALKSTNCVADVENEGMDEGRFFVHLKSQYSLDEGYGIQHTKSFGSFKEAITAIKKFK